MHAVGAWSRSVTRCDLFTQLSLNTVAYCGTPRVAECSEAAKRVFWIQNWILRSTSFKITYSDTGKYNTRVLKIIYMSWAAIVNSPGAIQNLRTPLPIDAVECSIVTSYCFAIHYRTRVYTASVDIVVAVSVCYIRGCWFQILSLISTLLWNKCLLRTVLNTACLLVLNIRSPLTLTHDRSFACFCEQRGTRGSVAIT
jgi:hypothetical protein